MLPVAGWPVEAAEADDTVLARRPRAVTEGGVVLAVGQRLVGRHQLAAVLADPEAQLLE